MNSDHGSRDSGELQETPSRPFQKITMSGDGVAWRKPYEFTTKMFELIGWKKLEVNRMINKFAGVSFCQ